MASYVNVQVGYVLAPNATEPSVEPNGELNGELNGCDLEVVFPSHMVWKIQMASYESVQADCGSVLNEALNEAPRLEPNVVEQNGYVQVENR
jgi:hypothetical protein